MSGKRGSIKARIQAILNTHKNDIKLIMKNIFVCENRCELRQVPSNLEGMHIPDLKWIKSYYTQQNLRLTNSLCRVIPILPET